ncbi:MAG: AEC family transporter [Pseudomonadota bacterium]
MALILQVLQIVAPVFALAAIGFGWVRLGLVYDVAFVTRLTMTLAIPCLIFMALARTEIDPATLRDTALATLAAYAGIGLSIWLLVSALGYDQRTFWAPLTFGNTGNIGLPVALFAFGAPGLDFAVVVFAIMAVLSFTVGVWVVSGQGSPLAAVREPMVWASVAGGVFLVQGWRLPAWAEATLDLIGQIGIPLMLITLGVAISQLRPAAFGRALGLGAVKLVICALAGLLAGLAFGLPPVGLAVLVMQAATPVAVTNYMLAQKYGANAGEVAGLVVVSTLLSVLAIPLLLAVFV